MQDQENPLSPEKPAAPELVENVADTGAAAGTPGFYTPFRRVPARLEAPP